MLRLLLQFVHLIFSSGVSQEERESVEHFLNKERLVFGIANDVYSFPKEFEDHAKAGSLDMIHNAMAVLMSRYGYTESEAESILKQEISKTETEALNECKSWINSSAPKSEELKTYVRSYHLLLGGANYWATHAERYQRKDLTTTAADRAQLVAKSLDSVPRLYNYPPPAAMAAGLPLTQKQENDSKQLPLASFLAPFRKAPAEEVGIHLNTEN
jgi:Terpene synthase family 2, C-terminal metal binding